MLKLILTTNNYNASQTLSWHFLSVVKGDPSHNSLPHPHFIEFPSPSPLTHYTQNLHPSIPLLQIPLFTTNSSYSTDHGFHSIWHRAHHTMRA